MCIGLASCGGPPHRSSADLEPSTFFVRRSAVLDHESSEIAWYDIGVRTALRWVGDTPEPLAELWVPDPSQFRLLADGSVVIVDRLAVHVAPGAVLESEWTVGMVNGRMGDDLWTVTAIGSGVRRCRLGESGTGACEDIAAAGAEAFCITPDGTVYFATDTSVLRHDEASTTVGLLSEPLEVLRCTDDGLLGWGEHTVVWELSDGLRSYDAVAPTTVAAADRLGDEVFVLTREQEQPPPPEGSGAYLGCEHILTTPCAGISGPPGFEPWSQYVLMRVGDPRTGVAQELAHQDCSPPDECWRETIREIAVDRDHVLLVGADAWTHSL